jgi:hypothetical protein
VQRQQDMDRAMMLPLLQGLSERQAQLFLMLAALTSRHQPEPLQTLLDADIAEAANALASTFETAGRGIVYEHRPASAAAARLMTELKGMIDEVVKNAGSGLERDAAAALRRIEHAAKAMSAYTAQADTSTAAPGAGLILPSGSGAPLPGRTALQQLFARVLAPPPGAAEAETPAAPASSIIVP